MTGTTGDITRALVRQLTAQHRDRVTARWAQAADHLRLLAAHGFTGATCPVCDDCPDWITNPPRRHP